jgi:hypothetical protein
MKKRDRRCQYSASAEGKFSRAEPINVSFIFAGVDVNEVHMRLFDDLIGCNRKRLAPVSRMISAVGLTSSKNRIVFMAFKSSVSTKSIFRKQTMTRPRYCLMDFFAVILSTVANVWFFFSFNKLSIADGAGL